MAAALPHVSSIQEHSDLETALPSVKTLYIFRLRLIRSDHRRNCWVQPLLVNNLAPTSSNPGYVTSTHRNSFTLKRAMYDKLVKFLVSLTIYRHENMACSGSCATFVKGKGKAADLESILQSLRLQ